MKKIMMLLATFFMFQFAMARHHDEGKGMSLEEKKTMVQGHIDKKIASLQEFKSCVAGASEKADIKKCRQAHRAKRGEMKAERKEMRDQRKKDR